MKMGNYNVQHFWKHAVSVCLVMAMLLPVAAQTLDAFSDSAYSYLLFALEQTEESQKEEQQEDNTKDHEFQVKVVSPYNQFVTYFSGHSSAWFFDMALEYVMEIPIPPPEMA